MTLLGDPIFAVALGVLLALAVIVSSTDNPARIPLRRFIFRALPALFLFFAIWVVLALVVYSLIVHSLASMIPAMKSFEGVGRSCFAIAVGLSVPLLVRKVKNDFFGPRTATIFRYLLILLQIVEELTSLYLGKVILQEERKAHFEALKAGNQESEAALDRLYEFHLVSIAQEAKQKSKEADPKQIFGLFKVHHRAVKFKLLLRYLGYKDCLAAMQLVTETKTIVLSTWPEDQGDRRHLPDRRKDELRAAQIQERRKLPHGRREVDSPYVQAFILGTL